MAKNSFVKVGVVKTHLEDVMLPMGLLLGSVDVEGTDLRIDAKPFAVTVTKKAHFEAQLRVKDLAAFLNEKSPEGLKNFKVYVQNDHLHVDAVKTILVDVPVKAICKLKIQHHTQIHVEVVSIAVMGSGATNFLQSQIEKINPVLDAKDFPVDAVFDHIEIQESFILVKGKMSPKG